jgi:ATP-binding cassette subfamily B protein/subfamily B ATP-binding cassette protein MsbA
MLGSTVTELLEPWPFKVIFDYILLHKPLPASFAFLDELLHSSKEGLLLVISLTIIFIAFFQGVFAYLQVYLTSRIGYEIVHTLRRELFSHLQRLSLAFHHRTRSGELLTKVTGDTNILKAFFAESILEFAMHFLSFIGMCVGMLILNWKLTLIVLATVPVLLFSFVQRFEKIRAAARKQRHKEGQIASRLTETLASVTLVQAFGREKYEEETFDVESAQTVEESVQTARIEAMATRTVKLISAVGKWAIVLVGSWQVLQGEMTPGDVLIFWAYVGKMYKPIQNLVKLWTKLPRVMVSIERMSEILEVEPEIQDDPQAVEATHLKGEIIFENVSFDYGNGKDVLKSASFTISPGQRVALVGASGAGKSTIVSLLLRFFDPQEGCIFIDGVNIKHYQRASLRREIGVVLQDSILFGSTIRENIAYGKPDATWEEIVAAAKAANAHDFIITLPQGYDTVIGERGSTLSGGQRQRVSLARTLIKHPSVLILDEPTAAVDAESAMLIWEAIDHLYSGKTALVIAHHFSALKSFDHILVLYNGEVVEQGTHEQLVDLQGYYYELFQLQNH